jgi:methionyl-tRNA synthetase
LPWDETHVAYVWFDALTNYITAAGYASDPDRFARVWPANIHSIGKDILRFHAVYWPAMLMAAGVETPTQVWAHGFLTVGGKKMSKTNLTGIHPFELIDHFGVDSYRYFFMRQIVWGADGDFSWEAMVERHNADLANGLGNLASRVLAMLASNYDGVVPKPPAAGAEADLPAVTAEAARRADEHMLAVDLQKAVAAVWTIVDRANAYLVEKEPWKLAKDPANAEELAGVLYASAETLRIVAVLIQPLMPGAAQRLWEQLGLPGEVADQRLPADVVWGGGGYRHAQGRRALPASRHGGVTDRRGTRRVDRRMRLLTIVFHVKLTLFTRT